MSNTSVFEASSFRLDHKLTTMPGQESVMTNKLLFTIAKTQKQLKEPSTDEWRRCGIYKYNGVILNHKKIK